MAAHTFETLCVAVRVPVAPLAVNCWASRATTVQPKFWSAISVIPVGVENVPAFCDVKPQTRKYVSVPVVVGATAAVAAVAEAP
jgi:hypothetical protein